MPALHTVTARYPSRQQHGWSIFTNALPENVIQDLLSRETGWWEKGFATRTNRDEFTASFKSSESRVCTETTNFAIRELCSRAFQPLRVFRFRGRHQILHTDVEIPEDLLEFAAQMSGGNPRCAASGTHREP